MHLAYNLTYTLSQYPADQLVNKSEVFMSLIRGLRQNVDILGAGGFAYAY